MRRHGELNRRASSERVVAAPRSFLRLRRTDHGGGFLGHHGVAFRHTCCDGSSLWRGSFQQCQCQCRRRASDGRCSGACALARVRFRPGSVHVRNRPKVSRAPCAGQGGSGERSPVQNKLRWPELFPGQRRTVPTGIPGIPRRGCCRGSGTAAEPAPSPGAARSFSRAAFGTAAEPAPGAARSFSRAAFGTADAGADRSFSRGCCWRTRSLLPSSCFWRAATGFGY